MSNIKRRNRKTFRGFTLIEVSIVLLIVGIITGSILKGKDLIELAQIKSVVTDIETLQIAYAEYINIYGALPGDDKSAGVRFKNVSNGDGDNKISASDAKKVFEHLWASGLIDSQDYKKPKIGGVYTVRAKNNFAWVAITEPDGSGGLSGKQATLLKAKLEEVLGTSSNLIATEPSEIDQTKNDTKYSLMVKLH